MHCANGRTMHTPGPWIRLTPLGIYAREFQIAECDCEENAGAFTPVELQANAQLIAAAPELLVACETALAMFKDNHCIDRFDRGKGVLRAQDIRELNETQSLLARVAAKANLFMGADAQRSDSDETNKRPRRHSSKRIGR